MFLARMKAHKEVSSLTLSIQYQFLMRNWLLFILLDICIFFFFQLHSRLSFCFHFQWSKYKTPDFLITMFSLYLYFSKVEMEADLVIEILLDSFSSCKMLLSCPLIFTVSQTKTKTKTHLPEILLLLLFLHRSHIWLSDCFKYFHFVNHFKSID